MTSHPARVFLPAATWLAALLCTVAPAIAQGAAQARAALPPRSWIDPDTGHRVIRLTDEPGSASLYFNDNGYTPDGKRMVYLTPQGLSVVDLTTFKSRRLVEGRVQTIVAGRKNPTFYYTKRGSRRYCDELWCVDVDTAESRKVVDLPRRGTVFSINADETLAGGVYVEGDAGLTPESGNGGSSTSQGPLYQATSKEKYMADRLAARWPEVLFTIDLRTGQTKGLIRGTDWLDHLQFSPTDPTLLIYAHEGAWQKVDRLWLLRTDGSLNMLVHRRTMENETAGHEWWGADGQTIYYQLHYPPGMQSSFVASYNVATGERIWYHYTPDQISIHHNSSPDGKLFCGDGGDPAVHLANGSPWIFLLRPVLDRNNGTVGKDLIKGGYLVPEKLVNLQKTAIHGKHNYLLEPNPSFTPDGKYIVFRSDMFGPTYVFAVEVARADVP
ncbi:MAG TPA: oligogalacturonate lyase family protein [Opitutaceae bacterium]|nr:oligogalacturonate lyase family protein [Opitutaceae bacterium]